MKRKDPFIHDVGINENENSSRESHKILLQQNLATKFSISNEDCKNYLFTPQFLKEDIFPEIIRNIPLFLLDPNISVGVSTSKPIMCNLLHGSLLVTNTTFGMDITRFSNISDIEQAGINICHATDQCSKKIFNIKSEIFITIKMKEVQINDKSYEFTKESDEGMLKTEKIFINDFYSAEFLLKLKKDEDDTDNSPSVFLTIFNQYSSVKEKKEISLLIESEIPLIIDVSEEDSEDKDEESDSCDDIYDIYSEIIRIAAPTLVINSSIQANFCDFLIASKLIIDNKIKCNKSFIVRANDISVQYSIETDELLIVSSEILFSNESTLKTSNLCAIFAENSFKCASPKMEISKNSFIKSKNVSFSSKKASTKINLEVKTIIENDENDENEENEEEDEEEEAQDSTFNNCFIQAEKVSIGPNFNIKADENLSIECSSLNISNRSSSIDIGEKLYLLFVTNNTNKEIGINNGNIKCYDLFFEVDSEDSSPVNEYIFKTTNAITVKNGFLLSSGTFENTGNVVFRSFYISAYSRFKCLNENSTFKVGDFLVVESEALFLNEGKIGQYSTLKPVILNSGKMIFLYYKENETASKGRGRKKNVNFFSKNSDDKKKSYSFKCLKFTTNGDIEGDYFSVIADDVISIGGKVKCQEIDLQANEISLITLANINAFKVKFKSPSIKINKGSIRALNVLEEKKSDDQKESNENSNKIKGKIPDSSVEIYYQKELVGDTKKLETFNEVLVEKINEI